MPHTNVSENNHLKRAASNTNTVDQLLAAMPRALRHYLLCEAAIVWQIESVYSLWREVTLAENKHNIDAVLFIIQHCVNMENVNANVKRDPATVTSHCCKLHAARKSIFQR